MPAFPTDPTAVAKATIEITDAQLEAILECALEVQHGRKTADAIQLLAMTAAPLLQELRLYRQANALGKVAAKIDNVFELVLPNFDAKDGGAA